MGTEEVTAFSAGAKGDDLWNRPLSERGRTFVRTVRRTLERYRMVEDGDLVVVAVSGGPDSVALLHVLRLVQGRWYPRLALHVAHLNHQLRGEESDADEQYVRRLADELDLPVTTSRTDVGALARKQRRNIEDVGREVRYRFLRTLAEKIGAQRIATGHTLTDQAETVLLRLVRGAGGDGLSAIHPVVDRLIIRPLLGVAREETRAFCAEIGVMARDDRTNLDPALTRNRIRLEVLPILQRLNPQVVRALGRVADNLRRDEEYFDELLRSVWPSLIVTAGQGAISLSVEKLNHLPEAVRWRVIRQAVTYLKGQWRRVTQAHYRAVESLLGVGRSGRQVVLPLGVHVRREFDVLTLALEGDPVAPYCYPLIEGQPLQVGGFTITLRRRLGRADAESDMAAVRCDDTKLPDLLAVRNRRPGDRYLPMGRRHPRKVKTLMQAARIPLGQRARWPLVVAAADDQIVCAPGLPPAAPFAADEATHTFALIGFQPMDSDRSLCVTDG